MPEQVQSSPSVERAGSALPGVAGFLLFLVVTATSVALIVLGGVHALPAVGVAGVVLAFVALFILGGFVVLQPNQASVLIMFGDYRGTLRHAGWWWTNPLTVIERRKLSLRALNFNSQTSKVNDANGNPINIAAVVVWRVTDTARATFDVQDFEDFVIVQSETAIRHLARSYPYDSRGEDDATQTLTGDAEAIAGTLTTELQARLDAAGVQVIETRLTDLSYAPEIAEAMLRRQQASAVVAARTRIVEGAVGMVQLALEQLEAHGVVALDEERKATMVSNLMTVLTSEQATTPIVNVGTLNR